MNVHWLERRDCDVPPGNAWQSPAEAAHAASLRVPKRRADWLLGRWTAKCAVAAYLNLNSSSEALARVVIRADASGAPAAFIEDQPAEIVISLSHSHAAALCTVAGPGGLLGCDLELVEARTDIFVADYFNPEESALVARAPEASRPLLATLIWSAKESALKSMRTGLRADTRTVAVSFDIPPLLAPRSADGGQAGATPNREAPRCETQWQPMSVSSSAGPLFRGWWCCQDGMVRTLVASPPPAPPLPISAPPR